METVAPRAAPQGPTVTAPPPTAQVSAPPPDLRRLEIGAKLDALVLQSTTKGTAEISTSFGKLQLSTQFPLPQNAPLQLQIIGKFPLLQLLITSVHGKSPQAALRGFIKNPATSSMAPKAGPAGSPAGATSPQSSSASISLTVGARILATKIGPSAPGPTGSSVLPTSLASSAPGNAPSVHVAGQAQAAAVSGASPASAKAATNAVSGTPPQPTTNSSLNQVGNQFSVRITGVVPPSQLSTTGGLPPSGSTTLSVGQSVTGIVTSTTALGQTIVQTHAGPINLSTPTALPAGTTVVFVVDDPLSNSLSNRAPQLSAGSAEVIMETHKWGELDDAVRTLSENHPTLGQQVVNVILPKADATLAANILLLISAIRGGDIRNWFGDAPVRALQRIRPELMAKLSDDFGQLSRLADDTPSNDWRSYPVPFFNGTEIDQIRLFIKRKGDDDPDDAEDAQGTRFIIDLDLSHMGRLQLDGLVKTQNKRFDLIIRTDNPLPAEVQNQIRTIFVSAIEQTSHLGGLSFQSAPANFLDILSADPLKPNAGLIV